MVGNKTHKYLNLPRNYLFIHTLTVHLKYYEYMVIYREIISSNYPILARILNTSNTSILIY